MKLKFLALTMVTIFSTGNVQAIPDTESRHSSSYLMGISNPYLQTFKSKYSAEDSILKIKQVLGNNNIKVFSIIDHQAAAKEVGLDMLFSSVVIFGKPQLGTPMMIESPTLAIDLPLKALVWESNQGEIFVSLNKPKIIAEKHNIDQRNVEKMDGLVKLISESVTK